MAQNLIAGAIGALLVAALCWASIRVSGVGFVAPHGWRELDPARRRAIGKAVSAGAAVEGTQAEAWLAAELASGSLARWSLGRRVGVPLAFGAFAVLLLAVALARGDVWTAIVALVLGLLQVTALVVNRRRRSRLQAAFAANLERAANGSRLLAPVRGHTPAWLPEAAGRDAARADGSATSTRAAIASRTRPSSRVSRR